MSDITRRHNLPPTIDARFGHEFRRLRSTTGVTMGDLARHLGWSVPQVSRVEVGSARPFADAVLVDVFVFLGLNGDALEPLRTLRSEVDAGWPS